MTGNYLWSTNIKVERLTLLGLVFIKETTEIHPVIPSSSWEACIDLLPHLELHLFCILNALHLALCVTIFALPEELCMVFKSFVSCTTFYFYLFFSPFKPRLIFFAHQLSSSFYTFYFPPRFFLSHTISVNRPHAGRASIKSVCSWISLWYKSNLNEARAYFWWINQRTVHGYMPGFIPTMGKQMMCIRHKIRVGRMS